MVVKILDNGFGNLASLRNALTFVRADFDIVFDTCSIGVKDRIILPGVGSFNYASRKIHSSGLGGFLQKFCSEGGAMLGICLGMQLMFESSIEDGYSSGLGIFPGHCLPFKVNPQFTGRTPHVGYLKVSNWSSKCSLWNGIDEDSPMYFVHSYRVDAPGHAQPFSSDQGVHGISCYDGSSFIAYRRRLNSIGMQFHPEKSKRAGIRLLDNFCNASTWIQ